MDTLDVVEEALDSAELHDQIAQLAYKLAAESEKNVLSIPVAAQVKDQEKKAQTIRETLQKSLDEYHVRMRRGMKLLGNASLLKIDPKKFAALASMVREHKGAGRGIQQELDLTDENMLSMYEYGATFFESKEYELAADVFLVLTFLNAHIPSFWIGLGMAEEMKENFQSAAFAYLMSSEVGEESFSWALKAAECFGKVGQKESVFSILDMIIDEANKDPRQAQILKKAQSMKNDYL